MVSAEVSSKINRPLDISGSFKSSDNPSIKPNVFKERFNVKNSPVDPSNRSNTLEQTSQISSMHYTIARCTLERFMNESMYDDEIFEELPLQTFSNDDVIDVPSCNFIIYNRRWLMLFIFSLNTMMNGLLFMSLSPINNLAISYYRVESVKIEWLSNIFLLTYVILSLPSSYMISKWGVRPAVTIASFLHFISASFHYYGYHRGRFWLVLSGQVFAAVAYCMILQVPGKLSSLWFPENEGATATSIGVFMNLFGVSIGFLQPAIMVTESANTNVTKNDLVQFFSSQLIMSGLILILTLAYKEQPPTPARSHSYCEAISFYTSLKLLWRNKDFITLSQSYGIYFGLFVTFSVLVNPIITSRFPTGHEIWLGWMGFTSYVAAMLSCLLIGIILDTYRAYKLTALSLNVCSMISWFSFVLVVTNTSNFTIIFLLYVIVGVFGVPYFASGIEQAAEITYPVSEITSSSIMLIFGNLYGFIFITVLGVETEFNHVKIAGYVMVLLYFISALLAYLTKTSLKRKNKENQLILSHEY